MVEASKLEEKPTYEIEVNGFQIKLEEEKLLAIDILKIAKQHGAMPGEPDTYLLQGDKKLYKPEDWVDVLEDKVFITVPNTATNVAQR